MVIGGIAIIARGVRRMTIDIDVVVRGGDATIEELLAGCAAHGIEARVDDAAAFARRTLVLLLRHEATGVELDVSLGWSGFEREALEARSEVAYGAVVVPMSAPEDLMIFKAIAGRPRDIADLEALLLLHPKVDLPRVRRRVGELAELAEAPELCDGLETALAKAARVRKSSRGG